MFKSYEIDYHGRCYFLGESGTIKEAIKIEKNALKKSYGEFPTFTENGKKCVTRNGNVI